MAGFRAETPAEVEVIVPASKLEEAKSIWAEVEAAGDVDWSRVDTGDRTTESQVFKPSISISWAAISYIVLTVAIGILLLLMMVLGGG